MKYFVRALLQLDILANVLLGGDVGQTISARAGLWAVRQDRGLRRHIGGLICGTLDAVDPGHCEESAHAWIDRKAPRAHRHYPYEGKIGNNKPQNS